MSDRPNIILLVGEDTGRHLGCYGDPDALTPHLDRLADQGARYTEAYSTAPVCAPSRSTLITGQYPQKIGTHHMRSHLLEPPRLFTQELRDAGYFVNWHSKLDFNFHPDEAFKDAGGWRDDDSDWLPRLAAGDLPDQPWLFYRNYGITHESAMWPLEKLRSGELYGARNLETNDNPDAVAQRHDPDEMEVPPYLPDTPAVRTCIAQHADNVTYMDERIGEVLDALDRSGQRDNTIVIFMVDHGRGLPREKRWCYTAGLQLPLIVRWPGEIEPGTVEDRLISWVDLAPTILSMTGTPIPDAYDGRAFLGPAQDAKPGAEPGTEPVPEPAAEREVVFAGRDRMDVQFDRTRAARDHRYHYIRNFFPQLPWAICNPYMERMPAMQDLRRLHAAGELHGDAAVFMAETKPEEELYDIKADPHCVKNLADDPNHAEAKDKLSAHLSAWIEATGDLGAVPERELIDRGLVEDVLDNYKTKYEPLPPEIRTGPEGPIAEMHEAEALGNA